MFTSSKPSTTMQENLKSNEAESDAQALKRIVRSIIIELIEDEVGNFIRPRISCAEAALQSVAKIAAAAFDGQSDNQVFCRPAELLEIARRVGAFPWIIFKVSNASELSSKEALSERIAFAKAVDKSVGRTFKNGFRFDAIGWGHSKRYKFTRPTA
jgi:hypothetical protein